MTTYAIGDLQGCYKSLQALLDKINFNTDCDQLWLTGDLVNRGPDSTSTLKFIFERRDNIICVLGNHDLHALACAHGSTKPRPKDTINQLLATKGSDIWLEWLQQQPLLYWDKTKQTLLVHAGIPPIWSINEALAYASEVESCLRSPKAQNFFEKMYGNLPSVWDENLEYHDRLRVITNYLTRMRFCTQEGVLNLELKGKAESPPQGFTPWFQLANKINAKQKIVFGHWAAIMGQTGVDNIIALDTGCVWGHQLTALNLTNGEKYCTDCHTLSK